MIGWVGEWTGKQSIEQIYVGNGQSEWVDRLAKGSAGESY
jgi:hypothetical protein